MRNPVRAAALIAALFTLSSVSMAQDSQFKVGTKLFSAGLLVSNNLGAYSSGYGAGYGGAVAFELGVAEASMIKIGVGAGIGYVSNSGNYYGSYGFKQKAIPIFALANGHYQFDGIPALDVYAGATLGWQKTSYSYDNSIYCGGIYGTCYTADDSNFMFGVQAGGRWEVASPFSVFAQVGVGTRVPLLFAGGTVKF